MDTLLSNTAFLVCMGLVAVSLVAFPILRAAAMLVAAVGAAVRSIEGWTQLRSLGEAPERPLVVTGLSPALADLARQTRYLALELRRHSGEAARWPRAPADPRPNWWSAFVGVGGYERPTDVDREVWEWLRSLEQAPSGERERLAGVGIDAEEVRAALVQEQAPAAQIRALAGLFASLDERLGGLVGGGYRGAGAHHPLPLAGAAAPVGLGRGGAQAGLDDGGEDDEVVDEGELEARRRRWADVLDRYGGGISRMAGAHARDRDERADLEQDIALALWQALPGFRGESSLGTFVYRIARYSCYRLLRRRYRFAVDADVDALGDPTACIETWMADVDDRRRLERALARLPEGLESPLVRRLAGESYAEIADALGISEQNVSVRLVRARARLTEELRPA